ncbi:MAG: hypothetical protein ACI8ZM_000523 [Crocinitomix sp.]
MKSHKKSRHISKIDIMKKLTLSILALAVLILSCKKNETIQKHEEVDNTEVRAGEIIIDPIEVLHGRLAFTSMDHLMTTTDLLDAQNNAWLDELNDLYGDLSDDDASEIIYELGLRYEQPFIDFQNSCPGFNSLLVKIEGDVDIWLDNEELNELTDPDNHFVGSKLDRAVLNENAEMLVGEDGYKYIDGNLIRINGNLSGLDSMVSLEGICDLMDSIQHGFIDLNDTTDYHYTLGIFDPFGNSNQVPGCEAKGIEEDHGFQHFGDHKLKWRVQLNIRAWGTCDASATTRNFRKKRFGSGWIRYISETKVQVYGKTVNPDDCKKYDFDSFTKQRKAFDLSKQVGTPTCKAQSGDVHGFHYGAAGNSYTSTLTF